MGLFDKIASFLRSEANDIGDMAEVAKDRLDEALSEREAELAMTPEEKLRSIQEQSAETDAKMNRIIDKVQADQAHADAVAEVDAPNDDPSPDETNVATPSNVVAEAPGAASASEADPAPALERPLPELDKTPAQVRYEEARAAADDLLDELRGELRDDGEI